MRRPGSATWPIRRLPELAAGADVLVSTIPADAAADYAATFAGVPVLLDAIYDPWPTPLAARGQRRRR